MAFPLRILAGRVALEHLHERGLSLADFGVVVAAAGGTKFLTLGGLDRVLFPALLGARAGRPLHCIGSSIGSLRLACLACDDHADALERLAEAYIGFRRDAMKRAGHFSRLVADVLTEMFGTQRLERIADHPTIRLHVLASRCSGLVASESRPSLLAGLGFAAMANVVSRASLALQLSRVVFHSRGERFPLGALDDVPTHHEALTAANLHAVLLSSSAVPFLVPGVAIPGGPAGVHRDGAIVDYHPVLALPESAGLVLYPHFFGHLTPGWFDRRLPHRRARGRLLDRTVVIAPTEAFVAGLPGGQRPSRRDVRRLSDAERGRRWRAIWDASAQLGDALNDVLAHPRRAAALAAPLP